MKEFAHKWYEARETGIEVAREKAEDLVKVIRDTPRVAALASNPLMLTIIALIHRVDAKLPNQRIKLYNKCTESLLDKWEAVKGPGRELMSEDDKRRRLEWIAYWMQDIPGAAGREPTVRREPLQQKLTELLVKKGRAVDIDEARAEAKLFLDHIRRRTGVLIERGRDMYSFVHLTFQEYFSACEVHSRLLAAAMSMKMDSFWEQELRRRLHDPRWQEVILLLMGKLNEGSEGAASELVKRILSTGSPYKEILHRDLLLAGRCLADDVAVDESLKEHILDRIFRLFWVGKYKRLRANALRTLVAMRDSRYEGDVADVFVKAMGDEEWQVRSIAADALGNLGTASDQVIDALIKAMGDEHSDVRSIAAYALGNLGSGSEKVMNALLQRLDREENSSAADAIFGAISSLAAAEQTQDTSSKM